MSHESELQIAVHHMIEKFKHYLLFKLHGNVSEQVKMLMIVFRFRSSFQVFLQTLPGGQKEVDCVQLLGLGIDFCNSYRVSLSEASLRDRKPQKSQTLLGPGEGKDAHGVPGYQHHQLHGHALCELTLKPEEDTKDDEPCSQNSTLHSSKNPCRRDAT